MNAKASVLASRKPEPAIRDLLIVIEDFSLAALRSAAEFRLLTVQDLRSRLSIFEQQARLATDSDWREEPFELIEPIELLNSFKHCHQN